MLQELELEDQVDAGQAEVGAGDLEHGRAPRVAAQSCSGRGDVFGSQVVQGHEAWGRKVTASNLQDVVAHAAAPLVMEAVAKG